MTVLIAVERGRHDLGDAVGEDDDAAIAAITVAELLGWRLKLATDAVAPIREDCSAPPASRARTMTAETARRCDVLVGEPQAGSPAAATT